MAVGGIVLLGLGASPGLLLTLGYGSGDEVEVDLPGAIPRFTVHARTRILEISTMSEITNPAFSDKDPEERIPLAFNFERDMEALGSALAGSPAPVVEVTRHSGEADESPSDTLDGACFVNGEKVMQWVIDGVVGCRYSYRCEAFSESGAKVVLAGTLLIRAK